MNLYLVGFMGSGKTSVGRCLAGRLGWSFLDLDEEILKRAGMSIRDIFTSRGEAYFRRLESEELKRVCVVSRTVIALGGGAFSSAENREAVQSTGKSIWLDLPVDIIVARCAGDDSRPLFSGRREMEKLLDERRPCYALADIRVNADDLPVDAVVDRILTSLGADAR